MTALPALFVTHGAPTLPLEDGPARAFLQGLGRATGRPDAILCVSAHWESDRPLVSTAERPETIHDFYGFPPALYELDYPAPGAPDAARRAAALLDGAGIGCTTNSARGLDHGAWTALMLMYPEADIPVAQLSVQSARGPAHHVAVGEALAPLREENVLVLASGSATHNLRDFRGRALDDPPPAYVGAFDDWLVAAVEAGRTDDLVDYRRQAPEAARNHPTEEHLLPLFVALGAGGGEAGRTLHRSTSWGIIAMTAFAFGAAG